MTSDFSSDSLSMTESQKSQITLGITFKPTTSHSPKLPLVGLLTCIPASISQGAFLPSAWFLFQSPVLSLSSFLGYELNLFVFLLQWNLQWFPAAVRIKCEFLQLVNKTLPDLGPAYLSSTSPHAPPCAVLCSGHTDHPPCPWSLCMGSFLSWEHISLPFGLLVNSCPFHGFLWGYRPVIGCGFLYRAFCDFWKTFSGLLKQG